MKSFGSYISKYLVSFVAFILILLFLNAVVFGLTFQKIVTEDYGDSSPQSMLEMTATAATPEQLSDEAVQMLRQNHIWAIYLNTAGQCYWSVDLPDNVPKNYTIQDVALFSKGYIEDYPVFIWNTDDGLLVLGYPTDSYTKLTSNYYSIAAHPSQASPSLCWGCLAWMCCASFQPITFPNAESFTIPNRLCPLWKLWQTESQFHFISAENYRKLQAV